ncbi:hypothetical protein DIPPA_19568 [Diplonema papillatum]|nr:hypothetical protein DIPPA_19568 [Diplonema papillatum]|eukprot:gene15351-23469_t
MESGTGSLPGDLALSQANPACVVGNVFEGNAGALAALLSDFEHIREAKYEPPEQPNSLTYGTYWCPLHKDVRASNGVEAYITGVSESVAFKRMTEGRTFAGAEWWWQDTTEGVDSPKEYHTDCDLHLTRDGNVKVHPSVSSVFYATPAQSPTVVFDQVTVSGDLSPPVPTKAVLSFPNVGQLLFFEGSLYHGVLHHPRPDPAHPARVTLLVNWWPERPNGPADLPSVYKSAISCIAISDPLLIQPVHNATLDAVFPESEIAEQVIPQCVVDWLSSNDGVSAVSFGFCPLEKGPA